MSIVAIALNLLLAVLLLGALGMGWKLNRRLIVLRDSHEGFAKAVAELDAAAQRAEQGLADLRAATDEAAEHLADRIEKARELTQKLDRLTAPAAAAPQTSAPAPAPASDLELNRPLDAGRLGALIGAARAASLRPRPAPQPALRRDPAFQRPRSPDDDLFEEPVGRMPISAMLSARR